MVLTLYEYGPHISPAFDLAAHNHIVLLDHSFKNCHLACNIKAQAPDLPTYTSILSFHLEISNAYFTFLHNNHLKTQHPTPSEAVIAYTKSLYGQIGRTRTGQPGRKKSFNARQKSLHTGIYCHPHTHTCTHTLVKS